MARQEQIRPGAGLAWTFAKSSEQGKVMRQIVRGGIMGVAAAMMVACGGGGGNAPTYTIGGTVTGLNGTLVLQDNGADDLSLTANGSLTFATALASGAAYAVTVRTQPVGQTCSVSNGNGQVAAAVVSSVAIACVASNYAVGGTVSGLAGTGLVLQNNGADALPLGADGSFTFATKVANGGAYAVSVKISPTGPSQTCSLANASGTVAAAPVSNVSVTCVTLASGVLDASFGTGGKFMTPPGEARGAVLQPDGKLVIATAGPFTNGNSFTLERFSADGSPDTAFGSAGKTEGNLGGLNLASETPMALVRQSDGKLVVAGWGTLLLAGQTSMQFALARYDANGVLDPSFGTGGLAFASFGHRSSLLWSLLIQPDGKLVAVGGTSNGSGLDFAVARFLTTGALDPSFGTNGAVTTDIQSNGRDDTAQSVALQADGKLAVAGWTQLSNGDVLTALARYNPDGSPDASFGGAGRLWNPAAVFGSGRAAIAVQGDGKILVSSTAASNLEDFALSRYNPDGSIDATYGSNGMVTTDFNNGSQERAMTVVLQADGKAIVGGFSSLGLSGDVFALARYGTDGSLDASFGTGGKVVTDFGVSLALVNVLLVQPDGKIVAVGFASNGTPFGAVARYIP
jgi:uncharacterized delta-60 repeat protein